MAQSVCPGTGGMNAETQSSDSRSRALSTQLPSFSFFLLDTLGRTYFLSVHLFLPRYLVCCHNLTLPSDWWCLWLWSEHVPSIFLEEWKKVTSIHFCSSIFRRSDTDCLYKDFEVKTRLNCYQNITVRCIFKGHGKHLKTALEYLHGK